MEGNNGNAPQEKQFNKEVEIQPNEEAEKQPNEEAGQQTNEEAEKQTNEEAEKQTNEEAEEQTNEEAEKQTNEEGEKQLNEEAEKQSKEEAEKQISEIEEKVAKKKSGFWKELKEWVVALVVALLVVFVIQTFLFRIIRVDGHSMDTTLADGERLFVTVTDVKFGNVDRDSVVICHYPNRYNKFLGIIPMQIYFVKRVVAVPGDTVYRKNEVTHVVYEKDGQTVDEMLDERYADYFPGGSPDDYDPYVLGEDEYFVVGDNRYNSHDSRDWRDDDPDMDVGPIKKNMIVGRVRQVIWPLGNWRAVH